MYRLAGAFALMPKSGRFVGRVRRLDAMRGVSGGAQLCLSEHVAINPSEHASSGARQEEGHRSAAMGRS